MTSDTASSRLATRRRYGAEVKARVVAECDVSGAFVNLQPLAIRCRFATRSEYVENVYTWSFESLRITIK